MSLAALTATLVVALSVIVVSAQPALGCSCLVSDPVSRLEGADAAFVGILVERGWPEVSEDGTVNPSEHVEWRFAVESVVKGSFGDEVVVASSADGASCGFEVEIGERSGVLLYEVEDGTLVGGLCGQIDPDVLLRAAQPPPAADATGPPVLVVGLRYGDITFVSFNGSGERVAYGYGAGPDLLSGCPDSRTFVGWDPGAKEDGSQTEPPQLVVRRYEDLSIVASFEFPELLYVRESDESSKVTSSWPLLVHCVGEQGSRVLIHFADTGFDDTPFGGQLVDIADGGVNDVVPTGPGNVERMTISGDALLAVTSDGRLLSITPHTGSIRQLASADEDFTLQVSMLLPSPTGRFVAVGMSDWAANPPDHHVGVFDVQSGSYTEVERPCDGHVVWLADDRLGVPDCGPSTRVYAPDLTLIEELPYFAQVWNGVFNEGQEIRYSGLRGGVAIQRPEDPEPQAFVSLDTGVIYSLLPVPEDAQTLLTPTTTTAEQQPVPTTTEVETTQPTPEAAQEESVPRDLLIPAAMVIGALAAIAGLTIRRRRRTED